MKKVLLIFTALMLITGCNNSNEEKNIVEINDQYETQYLVNITFEVPKKWYHTKDKFDYYYLDYSDSNIFLMVGSATINQKNITKSYYIEYIDALLKGMLDNSYVNIPRISTNEIFEDGDFLIANVDLKAEMSNKYRQFLFRFIYDNKTGVLYEFGFTSPDSISSENMKSYENVINSIKLR